MDVNFEKYEEYKKEVKRLESKAVNCVVTVSASEYVKANNNDISNYLLKGVQAQDKREGVVDGLPDVSVSAMAGLAKLCEELKAEVIVDVKPAVIPCNTNTSYKPMALLYLIGTAMVLKGEE